VSSPQIVSLLGGVACIGAMFLISWLQVRLCTLCAVWPALRSLCVHTVNPPPPHSSAHTQASITIALTCVTIWAVARTGKTKREWCVHCGLCDIHAHCCFVQGTGGITAQAIVRGLCI
jgi:hypothetical protein